MVKLALGGVCFAILSFCLAVSAKAAGPVGLTVTPPFQNITLAQNQTTQDISIQLRNSSTKAVSLTVSAVDFGDLDQSGGVLFAGLSQSDFDRQHGLAAWIVLDQDQVSLDAKSETTITAHLINNSSLTPGGHYGAILATSDDNVSSGQIGLHQSLASLLFVTKMGGEVYGINLNKLQPNKAWWGDVSATNAQFRNDGNVHVVPRGVVQVFDPLGRVIGKGVINADSSIILPGQSRSFDIPITQLGLALLPGTYKVVGQYRYDGTEVLQMRTQTFYQMGLLTPIVLVLVLAIGGWWLQHRLQSKD